MGLLEMKIEWMLEFIREDKMSDIKEDMIFPTDIFYF